ncbi:septal ring lytic transglycosylase RlpA family protein, partial [Neisseria sp. P0009.S010]|uniref:septal ring lytic transglycosylase RlpA family protein n=1 Tax=Neisseria sp. P0009.S010 TaxID=3436717 RepID=UPI003F7DA9F8
LSASHKTILIPRWARVTNMKTGKRFIVRVYDRGPFHVNLVIDVSKAAAQQLGFINQGSANVKVEQFIPGKTAAQTIITPN